jgi:hypothetical protein
MPKYRVKVYRTPPGTNSPTNVEKIIEAENEYMAIEKLKAEVQRQYPKYTKFNFTKIINILKIRLQQSH